MMSLESDFEHYLKGKTAKEIMTEIRRLKNRIGRLKKKMAVPVVHFMPKAAKEDLKELSDMRLYLERAKAAYIQAEGIYVPSEAESKDLKFQESISEIKKIEFRLGSFFKGYETRTYTIDGEKVYIDVRHTRAVYEEDEDRKRLAAISRDALLEGLRELHIGEWKRAYHNAVVKDGVQWDLKIHFSDEEDLWAEGKGPADRVYAYFIKKHLKTDSDERKPIEIYGSNAYPYNFIELKKLFGFAAS